ncbi:MAG: CBS domain-containing protein [Thermodesulfovibrionales bacterium]|jgi:signal-transduction protein with cAMP-binding, CBS, and nucleotidyltransferase domain
MKMKDILAKKDKKIITVDGHVTVSQAVAEMVSFNVGSVIVLMQGVVEGIFTERDAMRLWNKYDTVKDTPVMKFMTTNLIITNADDTIENALSVMSQKNIRHLLIVDGRNLLGVLSMKDVVRIYAGNLVANVQYVEKLFM